MHAKSYDSAHEVYEKDVTTLRRKALKCTCEQRQLSQQYYRTLGAFLNGNLASIQINKMLCAQKQV